METLVDIEKALAGDQQAFKGIVETYQAMVFTLCLNILKNREQAEEAAQDTFIKIYKYLHKFNQSSSLKTWIYRIARNTAIDYFRKHKNKPEKPQEHLPEKPNIEGNAQQLLEDSEFHGLLRKAIAELDEENATIISLYYFDEMSILEICETLAITKSNAKVKLFRARKHLKDILVKYKINHEH